jgi:hypothetical protein
MKLYMGGGAEPRCSGVKVEKAKSLDQKYWRMQRNKFKWFAKVWRLLSLDRRAMQIKKKRSLVYLKVSPMRGTRRLRVKGKLAPKIYRTIQDYWPQGSSGLSTWVISTVVRSAWCVSRITAEEVLTSARGATTHGISWPWRRFDRQWKANQDLGPRRMSDSP